MHGLPERRVPLTDISHYLNITHTNVYSIVAREEQEGIEQEGRGRYPQTSKTQDEAMVEKALEYRHTSYQDTAKIIVSDVTNRTINYRELGKNLKNR